MKQRYLAPILNQSGTGLPFAGGALHFAQCRLLGRAGPARVLSIAEARAQVPELLDMLQTPQQTIIELPDPWPVIMGIVNITPDSFHDGGRQATSAAAVAHGHKLAAEGAAILDVGGESTRPGADPVSLDEELHRVVPVIEALAADGLKVSVDTRKPEVMTAAVDAGAHMINDVTALTHSPDSVSCARDLAVPIVLMHSRGEPETMQTMTDYDDLILDILDDLSARVDACRAAGIPQEKILIDPGLGFAKTAAQSAELLRRTADFHALGLPVLIGASRKSFIGYLTDTPRSEDRLPGSLAAAMWAAQQGAAVIRVHDVPETVQVMAIFQTLCYKGQNKTKDE
jgi:dihydropteroate synthase